MEGTKSPEKLGLQPSPRGDVPLELFGGKQYSRGAAILHQLRIEVGDEAFRDGIRAYVRDRADSAVTSEDLRRSMEGACGRSLEWFFDQWVYGAGYPTLECSWEVTKRGHHRLVVEQTQVEGGGQPGEFRITVPVRGEAGYGTRLDVRRRRHVFDLAVPSPNGVRIGVGGGVFARIRVKQDPEAWLQALQMDTDVTGRMDAAEALPEWPGIAGPALAAALSTDPFWAVRREVARSLGRIAGKESLDALLGAIADPDGRVREGVVEALGDRNRGDAATAIRKAMDSDPNPYVRAMAARSLGKVHAEGAFEALSALLKTDSHRETLRFGAFDGLRALGDRRALDLARPWLRYDFPRGDHHGMREAALKVLLEVAPDEPETGEAVLRLLDDPWHRTRSNAAEAAGNYKVVAAEAKLRKLAESDPFDGVKAAAKAALEKIAPKKK